tara:strand:+ start:246 stop:389 length:144 start_codon:yes stop_codon:yes gene_type:complete
MICLATLWGGLTVEVNGKAVLLRFGLKFISKTIECSYIGLSAAFSTW